MTEPNAKSPIQMAGEVAKHVELSRVVLRSSSARYLLPGLPGDAESVTLEVEAKYKSAFNLNREGKQLDVVIGFSVEALEPNGPKHLALECTYVLRYVMEAVPDLDETHFRAFSELNALVNIYPYLRELLHSTTSKMAVGPLVLPLLKLGKAAPPPPKPTP